MYLQDDSEELPEVDPIVLSKAVVAILNELEIDLNKAPGKFVAALPTTDVEKLKYHYEMAMKADAPSGSFIDRVVNDYPMSKAKQTQIKKEREKVRKEAFMDFCNNIRRKYRTLTTRDGKEYEVTNNTASPLILRAAKWVQQRFETQVQYDALV